MVVPEHGLRLAVIFEGIVKPQGAETVNTDVHPFKRGSSVTEHSQGFMPNGFPDFMLKLASITRPLQLHAVVLCKERSMGPGSFSPSFP